MPSSRLCMYAPDTETDRETARERERQRERERESERERARESERAKPKQERARTRADERASDTRPPSSVSLNPKQRSRNITLELRGAVSAFCFAREKRHGEEDVLSFTNRHYER